VCSSDLGDSFLAKVPADPLAEMTAKLRPLLGVYGG
jgi:hypothetical protein